MQSDDIWDVYWETRLREMETLGKREAIVTLSRLVRERAGQGRSARMLELGSGEGQILGALVTAHGEAAGVSESAGIDYAPASVARARRDYPRLRFEQGDFTDPRLLERLGAFDIVLAVNALHEVFSDAYSEELGEVDVEEALRRVGEALRRAVERIHPGGWLVIFDGLEPPGDPAAEVTIRFLHPQAEQNFRAFTREYRPFRVQYRAAGPGRVTLSRHDFTRYIDKSIFLGKRLWETERLESYQYFTEDDFRGSLAGLGMQIRELRKLTVNEEKWRDTVAIETPGEYFPVEHIILLAQKGE
jgi:hypothetical protein